jgi:predicted HTH domain antitoxin
METVAVGVRLPAFRFEILIYDISLHCHMKNLQVRVGDDEFEGLDELAEDLKSSRSEVARNALREGVRKLRMEKALGRYLNLEFTLSRAAEYAGVTIREMAEVATERGIPFFRYSLEELRRDRKRATKWIRK